MPHWLASLFHRSPAQTALTTPPMDESLCDTCSQIDFYHILQTAAPKSQAVSLGLLTDILDRAPHCRFCQLVKAAFQDSWFQYRPPSEFDLTGITCSIYARGRGSFDSPPLRSKEEECHGLIINPSGRPREVSQMLHTSRCRLTLDIQLMDEDAHLFHRSKEAHGRKVSDTLDISLVKKWIQLCKDEHADVCQGSWWIDRSAILPLAVRMIDVKRMCLIPAPKRCRYLALSYVWGGVGADYQTMQHNVAERSITDGLDMAVLPATIVDSIAVCKQLGERYLWVDALCIVQDSPEDKAAQIGVMHQIYGCAYLTLFAISGRSAHAGLPGIRSGSRTNRQHIETVQTLHLAVPLPNLLHILTQSVWGSRGWTFQEAMLSCRRLFFTDHQVYFECLEEVWPEDVIAENRRSPQSFHTSRFTGIGTLTFSRAPTQSWLSTTGYTDSYMTLVNNYGPRDFTSELDAVDGISAITTAITDAFELGRNGFRYGMLLKDLDRALLWVPADNVRLIRRQIPKDAPWPSWAWIGWRGAIEYTIKWTQCGGTYPKVLGSLVDSWYLYEKGALLKLDSHHSHGAIFEGEENLPRYEPPSSDTPVELPEKTSLPEGTLVFRTSLAQFRVGDYDPTRSPKIADACNGTFVLHTTEASSAPAGRIRLPCSEGSHPLPAYQQVELLVLARSSGEIGLCDENVYGDRSHFLLVLAVCAVANCDGQKIFERVGNGIVSENAWLKSGAREEVVFLA